MPPRKKGQLELLPANKGPMTLVSDADLENCLRHRVLKSDSYSRKQFVDVQDIIWKSRHIGWLREIYPRNIFEPISVGVCSELAISDALIARLPAAFGAPKEQHTRITQLLLRDKEWLLDAVGFPGIELETAVNLENGYGDGLRYLYLGARDSCAVASLEMLLASLREYFGTEFPDAGETQGPYYEDEGRTEAAIMAHASFLHQENRAGFTTRNALRAYFADETANKARDQALRSQEHCLTSAPANLHERTY